MEIGFCLPHSGQLARPDNLSELAQYAEKKGFDALVEPSDHIVVPDKIKTKYPYSFSGKYTDTKEDLEQLSTISFVSAKTSRARLLSAITVLPYRSPFLAAKSLATIDVLSKGRLIVGVGIGWMKDEFDILRVPFNERGPMTDEYIQILRRLWTEKTTSFRGKYWTFPRIEFLPKPAQRPPPVWIGGESPAAIKRAALYGDAWLPLNSNPKFPLETPSHMKSSLNYLKACAGAVRGKLTRFRVGYMVGEHRICKSDSSSKGPFVGTSAKVTRQIRAFEEVGVSFFGFSFLGRTVAETKENVDRFCSEVIPGIRKQ